MVARGLTFTLGEPGAPRSATIDGALSEVHAINGDWETEAAFAFNAVDVALP